MFPEGGQVLLEGGEVLLEEGEVLHMLLEGPERGWEVSGEGPVMSRIWGLRRRMLTGRTLFFPSSPWFVSLQKMCPPPSQKIAFYSTYLTPGLIWLSLATSGHR